MIHGSALRVKRIPSREPVSPPRYRETISKSHLFGEMEEAGELSGDSLFCTFGTLFMGIGV